MHKKQKKPVNWGVFNDKELAEAIKKAEEGGGTGASSWDDVSNKPFETIGSGLSVDEQGILSATGGSGDADFYEVVNGAPTSGDSFYDIVDSGKICYVLIKYVDSSEDICSENIFFMSEQTGSTDWIFSNGTLAVDVSIETDTEDPRFIVGTPYPVGGAGGANWNAASGEAGFIANKPFDVSSETAYTVYADMSEPTPVEANKLGYFETISQSTGHTVYTGVVPINESSLPTFNVGDKFKIEYNGATYEDTITVITDGFPTETENMAKMSGTFEQPLFIGLLAMGGWVVAIIDDTLPTTAGSTIDISNYRVTGRTTLGASKIKHGEGLQTGENDELKVVIDNNTIVWDDAGYLKVNPAFNVPASTETNYPTVQEFNSLLTVLKNAGLMQPD